MECGECTECCELLHIDSQKPLLDGEIELIAIDSPAVNCAITVIKI